MAKKKTPEDLTWEHIFNSVSFDFDPPVKYIKDVLVQTKGGKKIRLSGREFVAVMEQERQLDPEHAIIESCRVNLDFERLKIDIEKFASALLKKSSGKYRKSRSQLELGRQLKKLQEQSKPPGDLPDPI
jgi:hypothetical protein